MSWLKSLITEVPAGTALVGVSMALVVALMVALAQIASSLPANDTFQVAGNEHRTNAASAQPMTTALHSDSTADSGARATTVSVMVPVGALR